MKEKQDKWKVWSTHRRRERSCQACTEKTVCMIVGVTLPSRKGQEEQSEESKCPHPTMLQQTQQTLRRFFSQTTIYEAPVALLGFTWGLGTDPSSPMKGRGWQGPYLAVCGADRKSDVGGDHHCESWGQFNGEAAVGGSTRDTSQGLFVPASLTPQGCQSLTRTFFESAADCWLGQMTLIEQETAV